MFIDESGFYLLPMAVRSFAPKGQTPILRGPLTRDHLSVIGAVTPAGQVYVQVYEKAIQKEEVVKFLRHLLRQIDGKLLVLWDGLPAHRSHMVKDFLKAGGAKQVHLVQFPGYAPELNPMEGVWNQLKRVEMKNMWCNDLTELRHELRKALARLRHKTHTLQGCVRQPGYV